MKENTRLMKCTGASTANLSLRSIYIACNTNLAACAGGLAWVLLEYLLPHPPNSTSSQRPQRFSILGFCSGIISGLVGITPACGFVPISTAPAVGALTAAAAFFTVRYKHIFRVDEGLDIFAIHGVGGVVGDILTGFFAAPYVPAMDGVSNAYAGGWWNRHWVQMGYQVAAAVTCAAWSFVVSVVLLFVIDKIPGCHIRASEEDELRGLDYKYFADVEDLVVLDGFGLVGEEQGRVGSGSGARSHLDVPVETAKRD